MSCDASLLWPKDTKYFNLIRARQAEAKTAIRKPACTSGGGRRGVPSQLPKHQDCPRDTCRGR